MRFLSLMIAYSLKQVFGFPWFTTITAVVSAYNLSCATPVVVLEPTSKIFYKFSVKKMNLSYVNMTRGVSVISLVTCCFLYSRMATMARKTKNILNIKCCGQLNFCSMPPQVQGNLGVNTSI